MVGAGLVGLSLAYELACLGARVTVIDAAHRGRATDAGAGILSPVTSHEDDPELWPFLRQAGAHYPALLERIAGRRRRRGGQRVRRLRDPLHRPARAGRRVVRPLRRLGRSGARRGRCSRSRRRRPPRSSHPWAPSTAPCTRPARRGSTAGAWPPCCVRRPPGAASPSSRAPCTGSSPRRPAAAASRRVSVEGRHNVDCTALAVAGGAWTAAAGEWLGVRLPVGPTKGQIVHLGVEAETGGWPIVQPLLTHYLVPWPGGRVACGGTFEAGAGFSVTPTAAGLQELLRECLLVAPGLAGAGYLETRVGLRPTSPDERGARRAVAGVGQRLGRHRARRQWAPAGAVLRPGAGARHGGRAAPRRRGAAAGGLRPGALRLRSTAPRRPSSTSARRPRVRLRTC